MHGINSIQRTKLNNFNESILSIQYPLVSLFIRTPDLGFLKPLWSKARFFVFDPARKIRDTNQYPDNFKKQGIRFNL